METTDDSLRRYRKQIAVPEIGIQGQRRFGDASVLVVGAGGLGCPALLYLAAAGVGKIGIVDNDTVDLSNLQRQIVYDEGDLGRVKADRAAEKLHVFNSHISIESFPMRLDKQNAAGIFAQYDMILGCVDTFETRYVISDECVRQKKMLVHASVHRFEGQVMGLCGTSAPCYRCLYPGQPDDRLIQQCSDAGVIGVLPGIIGSMQAAEALKFIVGAGTSIGGTVAVFDALTMHIRHFKIEKRAMCVCHGM